MAVGQVLPHRVFKPGLMTEASPERRLELRHVALLLLAVIAAALACISLIAHPPTQAPLATSYLPVR